MSYDDNDEIFSKIFIEKLSLNAVSFYTEYKTKKATKNLSSLIYQCDSLKNLLNLSIVRVGDATDININPIRQVVKANIQKSQVDVQANSAMYTELMKQLVIAKVTLLKETPLIQVIDEPVLPLKIVSLGKLLSGILFSFVACFIYILILIIKFSIEGNTREN
jgi:hypothetical protein